jgi:tRNA uridine 5-carboxymethylaminomethyl modification enzyme
MFTSRAEHRILLRQDDADLRLTERSYQLGLAKSDRYQLLNDKIKQIDNLLRFCDNYSIKAKYINEALEKLDTTPLKQGVRLTDLLLRPQLNFENLQEYIPALKSELEIITDRKEETVEATEIRIKYQGYIERERGIADKIHRLDNIRIADKFDYQSIHALSIEARQKLSKIQHETIGQASRIPGISPNDINILLVLLGR